MSRLANASPRDLIPGDPEAMDNLAAALRSYARGAADAAGRLSGAGDGPWVGDAADGFRAKLAELPEKLERGVDAFVSASTALDGYADVLRGGQRQAGQVIELAQRAEREHGVWRQQVESYNEAVRAGSVPEYRPPESSPGEDTMAEAVALQERARGSVEDAAAKAAATLREGAAQAPAAPSFGDLVRYYWEGSKQFVIGAGEATYGLGEFAFKSTAVYGAIDPEGAVEHWTGLAEGLSWGARHPVEFGKAVVDWETWKTNPFRALGHLAPDAALSAATVGGGAAARGASAARHAAEAADQAADIAADTARAADRASLDESPRVLDTSEVPRPFTAADGPPAGTRSRDPDFDGEAEGRSRVLPPGHRVEYLDEAAREKFRLFPHDGRLYGVDGRPFDTGAGTSIFGGGDRRAIFVMDEYGNIYASNYHALGEFHHSSFLAGEPVAGAGEIRVVNGRLEYISDRSGHYKPT